MYCLYIYFTFGPPYENKSCLNDLKLWGASENHKSSICWKFQLFISCGTQKSAKTLLPGAKMIRPFLKEGIGVWKKIPSWGYPALVILAWFIYYKKYKEIYSYRKVLWQVVHSKGLDKLDSWTTFIWPVRCSFLAKALRHKSHL